MAYQDPRQVRSPKNAIRHLKVLYDGGEHASACREWEGWSVAELEWYEEPVLALRWNGSTTNADVSAVGNPQSRRHPTWFIVPRPLRDAIKAQLQNAPEKNEGALTRAAAGASAPAFAAVWDNPEDDVYDAL